MINDTCTCITVLSTCIIITFALLLLIIFQETFQSLSETFDLIHRLCPTAYPVVIGTKADLRTAESVTTEKAEVYY